MIDILADKTDITDLSAQNIDIGADWYGHQYQDFEP